MKSLIDIVRIIHDDVYARMDDDSINVFLCGTKDQDGRSFRNRLQYLLKDNPKLNVIYPEWLFPSLMKQPDKDLLSLEQYLADNVDVIVIPLEGPGAICELGAFASSINLIPKIIVLNDMAYKRSRSFIAQGPIRLIRNRNADNVFYYSQDQQDKALKDVSTRLANLRRQRVPKDVTNLFNLYRFIALLLTVLQPITKKYLEEVLLALNLDINRDFIDPSIEILVEKGHVYVHGDSDRETIRLTDIGYVYYMDSSLARLHSRRHVASLRSIALWRKSKDKPRINLEKERARLLD